ncbi:DNA-directed RNA polymerase subunit L [Candidatus Micrarchaeota archaeon]|nr:DNA-directed RNA polymerase subunit L [Candidatus Micrarchaeota archaeon]
MEIKIFEDNKNELEFEVVDWDSTIAEIIIDKLNTYKEVEFAAYKIEHPLINGPKIYIKSKLKEPKALLLKATKEISSEIENFSKLLSKK